MKDINGNEFKVGCVFKAGRYVAKVLDIRGNRLMGLYGESIEFPGYASCNYTADFLEREATILHYKELAPDKNGKMLCEGDTVLNRWNEERIARGFLLGNLVTSDDLGLIIGWSMPTDFVFFSRPTDDPKQTEMLARLKAMEDAHAKEGEEIAKLKKEIEGGK